jgi:hypothetical protein
MATRLDGFYYARYEGMNEDGSAGQGVVVLKDGKVYGGDSTSCFVGAFEEQNRVVVARVGIYPLWGAYQSVGFEDRANDLIEIRARLPLPEGELASDVDMHLDAEPYDKRLAISLYVKRLIRF